MSNPFHLSIRRPIPALFVLVIASLPVIAQADDEAFAADEAAVTSSPPPEQARAGSSGDPGVEYIPFRGLVVATEQGSTGEAAIEIDNRAERPLEITGIEHESERFTARIETIEPGQRYRLIATFDSRGFDGKAAEMLYLTTNRDRLAVPVHTAVIPRVYTFPRAIDMGKFPLSEIRGNPETARTVAQILMVYRKNTTDFEIEVTSDVPFLNIESEQGSDGDRWENTIWLDPERVQPGEINGTIFIDTNDPQVPKLEVPVTGQLLDR